MVEIEKLISEQHEIETNMDNERLKYIDLAKFVGIFCMVWCHAGMQNVLTSIIYAFHMPLFFFLSGYLFDRSKDHEIKQFVTKRAYAVLVPYVFFSLILCYGSHGMKDWFFILYASRDALANISSFTPLWFLPCFFCSSVLFFLINKVAKNKDVCFYLIVVIVGIVGFVMSCFRGCLPYGYPFNFDTALVGVLLMGLGKATKVLNIKYLCVWGGVLLAFGVVMSLFNLPESLTYGNPHVEMATSSYGNPLLFVINAWLICAGITILMKYLEEKIHVPNLLKLQAFYGANTITILCIHGIILAIICQVMQFIGIEANTFTTLLMTLICFAVIYPIINFFNNKIPNIIGKY